jgi:hypothetical protein
MDKIEEYQAKAAAALDLAQRADAVEEKLRLLEAAQRWLTLAISPWASAWADEPDRFLTDPYNGRHM